jgi:hypothetical protein
VWQPQAVTLDASCCLWTCRPAITNGQVVCAASYVTSDVRVRLHPLLCGIPLFGGALFTHKWGGSMHCVHAGELCAVTASYSSQGGMPLQQRSRWRGSSTVEQWLPCIVAICSACSCPCVDVRPALLAVGDNRRDRPTKMCCLVIGPVTQQRPVSILVRLLLLLQHPWNKGSRQLFLSYHPWHAGSRQLWRCAGPVHCAMHGPCRTLVLVGSGGPAPVHMHGGTTALCMGLAGR